MQELTYKYYIKKKPDALEEFIHKNQDKNNIHTFAYENLKQFHKKGNHKYLLNASKLKTAMLLKRLVIYLFMKQVLTLCSRRIKRDKVLKFKSIVTDTGSIKKRKCATLKI